MRVMIEVRNFGHTYRVERDVPANSWIGAERTAAAQRQGVIDASNALLRSLGLGEITETAANGPEFIASNEEGHLGRMFLHMLAVKGRSLAEITPVTIKMACKEIAKDDEP